MHRKIQITAIGACTIYEAQANKEAWLAKIQPKHEVEVNLAGVEAIDIAGVQVLVLLKKAAQSQQATLKLVQHSKVVQDLLDRLGLTNFFGDPMLLPASQE